VIDAERLVDWGEPRSRVITWHDPRPTTAAGAAMSGVEFLRAIQAGRLAPPPTASVFGFVITDVEVGRVAFECTPDESAYNPIGVVHGGLVCTLADTVVGCAVQTTVEPGTSYTSIDLNVSYLRPVTIDSGVLRAVGTVIKPGKRVAYAAAEIRDGRDKLVATATSSLLIMPATSGALEMLA
jgi:uncharacterized protein (TIGR00369 family)